ncbi:reverse transcriptase domain-containing protein [Tanacetum coccineum]
MVKKHDGSWRMCVDFTDLNKACPQDCYPLPEIDWKVESLYSYPFKCFLDVYKGYHQIHMAESDKEKTSFHTSQGVYCYTKMPFGLKNAGATYHRLVDKAFDSQVGRNIEVYIDDLLIKSHTKAEMLRDIDEMFQGIKPCLSKTEAMLQLPSSRTIKEVQSLNGKLASLNISTRSRFVLGSLTNDLSSEEKERASSNYKDKAMVQDGKANGFQDVRGRLHCDLIKEDHCHEKQCNGKWYYFKDKMLLMQAQESGAVLDEEQSLFLAGEQVTNVDDDVDDSPENDLALNVDHVFEADECDAFDSDVDEGPITQTMFMTNLTPEDRIYDEAGTSYDSNTPSEVHDHDTFVNHLDEYHEVHEMQTDEQHNYVVDFDAGLLRGVQSRIWQISQDMVVMNQVSISTEASGSKPRSNTKKNRILPAKKENKKEVEVHLRTNKYIGFQWRPKERNSLGKLDLGLSMETPQERKFALGENVPLTKYFVKCRTGHDFGYLDSGCSKHYNGKRSKLHEFLWKSSSVSQIPRRSLRMLSWVMEIMLLVTVMILKLVGQTTIVYDMIDEMMKSSPICLMSKASKSKSWLWHRRLNHLNFGTINDLARKDLVRGLPRLKFEKKNSFCSGMSTLGKSQSRVLKERIHLSHRGMGLYSDFTWVKRFLSLFRELLNKTALLKDVIVHWWKLAYIDDYSLESTCLLETEAVSYALLCAIPTKLIAKIRKIFKPKSDIGISWVAALEDRAIESTIRELVD